MAADTTDSYLSWPERRLLEIVYEAFRMVGDWPVFQHVSTLLWHELEKYSSEVEEPRDVYFAVSSRGLVRPPIQSDRTWELRNDTSIGLTLAGLAELREAADDLNNYLAALRYIAERARKFRPPDPRKSEYLEVTSEEVRLQLRVVEGDMALLRLARLLHGDASGIWTSFAGPDERGTSWSISVDAEIARRYASVVTVGEVAAVEQQIRQAYAPASISTPTSDDAVETTYPVAESGSDGDGETELSSDIRGAGASRDLERTPEPMVFISYSHHDRGFVAALTNELRRQRVRVWIDTAEMVIGDSLVRRIGDGIRDGDFVVGIVSAHSIKSPWCQKELALAETHGINAKRVKVLPVRLGDVEMPAFLQDAVWGDASDLSALAVDLARAIKTHLRRDVGYPDAQRDDEDDPASTAALSEDSSDLVPLVDQLAERIDELLYEWDRSQRGSDATDELRAEQRRLRTLMARLPSTVEAALPLVSEISTAAWDGYFSIYESAMFEDDLREEIQLLRTQLAASLPVVARWRIDGDAESVSAGNRDAVAYLWTLSRAAANRRVAVYISGTVLESARGLPHEVELAKTTHGRSAVVALLSLDDPPPQILVTSDGIRWELP